MNRPIAPKLEFKLDSDRVKTLKLQGVDGHAFSVLRRPFELDAVLEPIVPKIPAWLPEDFAIPKTSVNRKINNCNRLLNNPLHGSPIICISSMVTDERAKFLAMCFMSAAIDQMRSGSQRGKQLPVWHRLLGGFNDKYRDGHGQFNPSMLILTNVAHDSTNVKLEKLRDILELYDSIPRIVVVNGSDPVSFFAEKVRMPLSYAFFMNNRNANSRSKSLLDI